MTTVNQCIIYSSSAGRQLVPLGGSEFSKKEVPIIEFILLIPVVSNAGQEFSEEHHGVFEGQLLDRFGGYTRLTGLNGGGWKSKEGVLYKDATLSYAVALASVIEAGKLGEVITFAKVHYDQEAIYLRYLGLSEAL